MVQIHLFLSLQSLSHITVVLVLLCVQSQNFWVFWLCYFPDVDCLLWTHKNITTASMALKTRWYLVIACVLVAFFCFLGSEKNYNLCTVRLKSKYKVRYSRLLPSNNGEKRNASSPINLPAYFHNLRWSFKRVSSDRFDVANLKLIQH